MKDYFVHKRHLCLVFELLSLSLYDLVRHNQFRGLSLNLIRVVIKQVIEALVVLRDAKIIHCDLKAGGNRRLLLPRPDPRPLCATEGGADCSAGRRLILLLPFFRFPAAQPENILLKGLDSGEIKVIDFGSACFESRTVYSYIQSRFYRSPEVVLRQAPSGPLGPATAEGAPGFTVPRASP